MIIIDGKKVAESIKKELITQVSELKMMGRRAPHLAAILVGNDGASQTYVNSKKNDCIAIGFDSTVIHYPETIQENELLTSIHAINQNPDIDGLIVQLPLPKHISEKKITESIYPEKDVDGFHAINMGLLAKGEKGFIPATPMGVTKLIQFYGIETTGKHCVVVGRSNIVGRPMSILMSLNEPFGNATVTLCHSKTSNLSDYTKSADILIVALGKPEFITAEMVKPGAVVIDVGITRVEAPETAKGYKIKGDVHFDSVCQTASAITPVPGGVGVMTRAGLLANTFEAYKRNYLKNFA